MGKHAPRQCHFKSKVKSQRLDVRIETLDLRPQTLDLFEKAEQISSYCCFPNRLEDILALRCANKVNPSGAKAYYYLGCLYYDKRQYDVAVEAWEESARLDETFPSQDS